MSCTRHVEAIKWIQLPNWQSKKDQRAMLALTSEQACSEICRQTEGPAELGATDKAMGWRLPETWQWVTDKA